MPTQVRKDHSLEGLKLFPVFAWGVVIMFAAFVYVLTSELRVVADTLETTASINATIIDEISPKATTTKAVE